MTLKKYENINLIILKVKKARGTLNKLMYKQSWKEMHVLEFVLIQKSKL